MPDKSMSTDDIELGDDLLLELYRALLVPRLVEEKMLLLLRKGKITKWFAGIGQEAISVGCTAALYPDEYILTMHRNLGVFTTRKVPLRRLFSQFQGKGSGFTQGRDRSFHFGAPEFNIVGMISHLGPQLGVADGIALAKKLKKEKKVTLAFTGEGGTSEGDFHEALNVAAVWELPVIFVIENNGYGLSTPTSEQYRCKKLSDRAKGYGIKGVTIDGNNVSEVYRTVSVFAESIRKKPRPVLIECDTFRMRGHEEASGTKYVPPELFEQWAKKDPIAVFEEFLKYRQLYSEELASSLREEINSYIDSELEAADAEPGIMLSPGKESREVFQEYTSGLRVVSNARSEKRFVDAISDGLRQAMRAHKNLILMGQDIAEYGGVFKVTEGFVDDFGRDRVRNTPLCESAILGAALGLSIGGYKSVVEMQFSDFATCGFNQIVNNLAKVHYRWGQNADVVVRMPCGGGTGAGPFHSQTNEAWYLHAAGLKVVYPSTPYDAKGLLLAAIEDPNPVLFFEHKVLYRSVKEEIPDDYYPLELGSARVVQEGEDIAVITYGAGVHWAKEYAEEHPEVSMYLVDLRCLYPLDYGKITEAVEACSRVVVLHEAPGFCGPGGEIASYISEHCFDLLDAPVVRCSSLDTPVPFAAPLEAEYLAKARLAESIERVLSY